uniref:Uncharacterized protein LOC104245807 n=1 Tax=Nicotiana sylvestris TaxID=4096 RepID=A0A1U7Y9K0_NICSY|nr:PREDICTED: uncharacterized protein LOC104245807 [Nicotiana sylvestris]
MNRYWYYRNVVEDHLVVHGFVDGYTKWVFHGKGFSSRNTPHPSNGDECSTMCDDIDGLLHDTFRNIEGQAGDEEGVGERLSKDAKKFFKLLEEGKQELYPGCENFSKLSFTIRLYLLKSLHGLSNVAFSDLLELIKEAFPFAQKMSKTNTENRNRLKCPHTTGRTPFALIREEKKKEISDTSDTLSSKDIFVATRKRKLGRVYKSSYDNTISKIAEMERIQSTQESEDGSHSVDAFASVMGPEHPRRVRLYGRGVTKTLLKGQKGNLGSSLDVDERMQQKIEEM